jgi:hypothetical protein
MFARLGSSEPDADLDELTRGVNLLIQADDRSLLGRLRSLPTLQRRSLFVAVALGLCALVLVASPRPHLGLVPWEAVTVMVLASAALGWSALAPLTELTKATRRGLLYLFSFPVPFLLPYWLRYRSASDHGLDVTAQGSTVGCLGFGLGVAVALVVTWRSLSRSACPLPSDWALAALSCGLWANVSLQLHCPVTDTWHLLVSHGGVLPVVGLIAAAAYVLLRRPDEPAPPLARKH